MNKVLKCDDYSTVFESDNHIKTKINSLDFTKNELLKLKLELSKDFKYINGLVVPESYTINNGIVSEIIYPKVLGISFPDYINEVRNISLHELVCFFKNVERIMKQAHNEQIIIPDLLSNDNIKYDPISKEVHFIDYHDMQVRDLEATGKSDFIFTSYSWGFLHSGKYYNDGLFTKNIDLYSLYIAFIYYCTKINLTRSNNLKYDLNLYLLMTNMPGFMRKKLLTILDDKVDCPYLEDSLDRLDDNYELTPFEVGQPRLFIRK